MKRKNFKIIFKKLAELQKETLQKNDDPASEFSEEEAEEIEEIRRLSNEIQNPDPQSYTTT